MSLLKDHRLKFHYSNQLLISLSFGWLFLRSGFLLLPPLLPNIIADLSITISEAGIGLSILWGIYSLNQFPSGQLSDILTRKTLIILGIMVTIIGFIILVYSNNYFIFISAMGVIGFGAGLYPTAARALISDQFSSHRGWALGTHAAAGDVGGLVAAGIAAIILGFGSWHIGFIPTIFCMTLMLFLLHIICRENYRFRFSGLSIRGTLIDFFRRQNVRRVIIVYSLYAFIWQGITSFLPSFLQAEKGFSPELASAGFAILFLIGIIVKPTIGAVSDRFPRMIVGIGVLLIAASALTGMVLLTTQIFVIISIVIFAGGLMSLSPVLETYLTEISSNSTLGSDLGIVRSFAIGIGSLGPAGIGFIADMFDFSTAFTVCIIILLVDSCYIYYFLNNNH